MKSVNSLTLLILITTSFFSTLSPTFEKVWADEVIKTIRVGDTPWGIEYNPDNNKLYVTNSNSGTVSVIDSSTNDVIGTIIVGKDPLGIAYNPSNEKMYLTNSYDDTVFVRDVTIPPIADAGPDQALVSNDLVQLDGSNSSDPNGSSLTYFWNQSSGPDIALSDSTTSNPTFTTPEVNEPTD